MQDMPVECLGNALVGEEPDSVCKQCVIKEGSAGMYLNYIGIVA